MSHESSVAKFTSVVVENEWAILFSFLLGILISLWIFFTVETVYVSRATTVIEEPRSKSEELEEPGRHPGIASQGYVASEAEKLRSPAFHAKVLRITSEGVKEDFAKPLDKLPQILGKWIAPDEDLESIDEDSGLQFVRKGRLLTEMFDRLTVEEDVELGLISLTTKTHDPMIGPILLKSVVDVWQAVNLEENRKVVRARTRFAEQQRDEAHAKYLSSQEELAAFKKRYDISGTGPPADPTLQMQYDRLDTRAGIDRERFIDKDRALLDAREREAGVQGNIRLISPPAVPGTAEPDATWALMLTVVIVTTMLGIVVAFLMDRVRKGKKAASPDDD